MVVVNCLKPYCFFFGVVLVYSLPYLACGYTASNEFPFYLLLRHHPPPALLRRSPCSPPPAPSVALPRGHCPSHWTSETSPPSSLLFLSIFSSFSPSSFELHHCLQTEVCCCFLIGPHSLVLPSLPESRLTLGSRLLLFCLPLLFVVFPPSIHIRFGDSGVEIVSAALLEGNRYPILLCCFDLNLWLRYLIFALWFAVACSSFSFSL